MDLEPISWITAEPAVLEREHRLMPVVAPGLEWQDDSPSGGWRGHLPRWPFERPEPSELGAFLGDRSFLVLVHYEQSFPMVEPRIYPLDPVPDLAYRSLHDWHLNGDGSLCLLRQASDWDGTGSASEIAVKASAWFLEYLLLERGIRTAMTESGIAGDGALDHLFSIDASVRTNS
jgi:hypothetical protein